jgi:hypothetical protein
VQKTNQRDEYHHPERLSGKCPGLSINPTMVRRACAVPFLAT